MQISDNNFSAIKTGDKSPIKKKHIIEKKRDTGDGHDMLGETREFVKEASERVQRAITKERIILSGLDSIKSNIISTPDTVVSRRFVEEAIDKTRFENERVLDTYRLTLLQAASKKDASIIDAIVERVNGTISSLYSEFEKNEITKQNILSVATGDSAEDLIKSVIVSLKRDAIPSFTFERERILDLLRDN